MGKGEEGYWGLSPIPIVLNNNKNKYLIKNNFIFLQNYNIKIVI